MRIRPLQALIGIGIGVALAGGGYAIGATATKEIHACANTKTHVLTEQAKCPRGTKAVVWAVKGPAGVAGRNGTSVTLNPTVNVTQVGSSTPASGSITQGANGQDTLNLSIPQGATGPAGAPGAAGASTGPNAYGEIWMGSSGAQLAPDSGSGANIQTVSGGGGSAFVKIVDCAAATPTEPIITVTPNRDTGDTLAGADDTTSGLPTAYVNSYGNDNLPGDHVLTFTVETTTTTNQVVNSDFSFTVSC